MSDSEDILSGLEGLDPLEQEEKGKSKLHDPTPQRKKYVTDLLYRFLTDQITYAQLTGLKQKDLRRIAEVGHVKLKHGRTLEAKKIFECLAQLDNQNPFYEACLGSVYQKMGKYVDAVYHYSEALRIKNDDMPSLVHRGEVYLKHKNYKRAAEDFRGAILSDPQGKNMFANRARSLVIAIKRNLQMQKQQGSTKRSAKSTPKRVPSSAMAKKGPVAKPPRLPRRPR